MELDVQRAKELIEQKLAEEEEKVGLWGRGTCLGPALCYARPWGFACEEAGTDPAIPGDAAR